MKYSESVRNSLLVYSTIHGTRLDVDNHLFATNGNGYAWVDGELSDGCTKAYGPYDAVQKVLEFELTDHYAELGAETFHYCLKTKKSEDTLKKSDWESITYSHNKKVADRILRQIEDMKRVDSRYDTYEHIPDKFEIAIRERTGEEWKIYPICEYAKLVTFPDDIKPDWKEALYHFVCWCLDNQNYLDDKYDLPEQIKYLEEAKKRLETL